MSIYEDETKDFLNNLETKTKNKIWIKIELFKETLFLLEKLLMKCKELRSSRNLWKERVLKNKRQFVNPKSNEGVKK